MSPRMYLFARFRLERAGAQISLRTRKTESLLAYLALNPQPHARERLAALLWGMYYSHWRHIALRPLVTRLGIVSIAPFLLLALYTSARESAEHDRTVGEHIMEMRTRGDIGQGIVQLMHGQYCASHSMWLLETHPDEFPHRHLMTVWRGIEQPSGGTKTKPSGYPSALTWKDDKAHTSSSTAST